MRYTITTEREGGRWIASIEALQGCTKYGATEAEARCKTAALALAILADQLERGEVNPEAFDLFEVPAATSCSAR